MLASVAFTGCVDEVVIPNQSGESQKLVLYARLCPQLDSTYILLSNTQLLYSGHSGSMRILDDGVVELSADGSHWVRAHFDTTRNRYLLTREEFPVEEGRTYHIRASHEGFAEVSASCTVPVTRDVGFRFDTVMVESDVHYDELCNWPHKDVYVEWRDVPGEQNAYALFQYRPHTYYTEDPETGEWTSVSCGRQYYNPWLTEDNRAYQYVSDEGRDGQLMRYLLYYALYEDYEDDEDEDVSYCLFFLDRNCYLYETTLTDDYEMVSMQLEPPHTFSNIGNGFGLFGAFSMREVK